MKYLVPIDGSKQSMAAVEYAAKLAEKFEGSTITLAYVIMYEPYFMDSPELIEKNGQAKASVVLDEAEKMLASYSGIGVRKVIEHGSSAADKIAELAETGKHDAIVMGSQGLSNLKRFLMGSVSTRVSQYAPCTVVLVR